MVEEAKVRITIDPAQARRELDRTERARAGGRRGGVAGAPAGAVPGVGARPARRAGGGARAAAGAALGRKFGGAVLGAARTAVGALALATLIPVLSELIKSGFEDLLGDDPFSKKVKDLITGTLDNVTDNAQTALAAAGGTIKTIGETIQLGKGLALTGQQLDPGEFLAITQALARVNIFETKVKFDLHEAGITQATRNSAKQIRKGIADWMQRTFLNGSK